MLRGGSLGDRSLAAILLCSLSSKRKSSDWQTLEPGTKAVFFCASAKGLRRLVTTPIRKIDCTESERVEDIVSPAVGDELQ